jgi:hypothetical protein
MPINKLWLVNMSDHEPTLLRACAAHSRHLCAYYSKTREYWHESMKCPDASTFLRIIKSESLFIPELIFVTLLKYKRILAAVPTRQEIRFTHPTKQKTQHTTELTGPVDPDGIRVHLLNNQE